jgi:hypothetical protein
MLYTVGDNNCLNDYFTGQHKKFSMANNFPNLAEVSAF